MVSEDTQFRMFILATFYILFVVCRKILDLVESSR